MVHFGFSLVILIMTILAFVWLDKIQESNDTVLELIEQYDTKIEHAYVMRSAVLYRYNQLLSLLIIDDPFELDEKISEFYHAADIFRYARSALHEMPMSLQEIEIHKRLDEHTLIPQQYNVQIAEMFRDSAPKEEIIVLLKAAREGQAALLSVLDEFVALQKEKDEAAVNFSKKIFGDSIYWISLFGVIAFLISVAISRYVGRAVADKNEQLLLAGKEMARAYKKAEAAALVKSDFLATMSHEMRTPLTAIIGFAETTLFSEQTIEQRQNAIQTIIRSGKHLLQIINNILDLSKVEANKLNIEKVELMPFELLADVEILIRPSAEEKGLGFSINYMFPLPKIIINDPLRIKQILINLCNNAIKFTEEGYVLVNVSSNIENGTLLFEVADTGVGINEEQQKFIFDAYRQADSSTTRRFGGTGLGLSLSKELAENLGGSLKVESEPGEGSKFKLSLSFDTSGTTEIVFDREHIPKFDDGKVKVKPSIRLSGHVLLAEDSKDNQDLFSIYLHRMGVEVTIVENGQLAINAVKENNFDLVLMDVRMPVMNGHDAMKALRDDGFDKPIIAITANAMQEDQDACFDCGANDFLTKPIDVIAFGQTLQKYLKEKVAENNSDASYIYSLLESEPNAVDLIRRFIHHLTDDLSEIEELIYSHDWKDLIETLNKLKNSSGSFGCPGIAIFAGKMEFQATSHNTDELNNLFSEMSEYCKTVINELSEKNII